MSSVQERKESSDPVPSSAARKQNRAVERAVQAALHRANHLPLRGVTCLFDGGLLELRGKIPSYYLRQVAYATVSKVEGVVVVDDQLEVS